MTTTKTKTKTQAPTGAPRRLEGIGKEALETGRNRLLVTGVVLALAFGVIGVRIVDLTVFKDGGEPALARIDPTPEDPAGRADIIDRNGVILATSLPTASLYADPEAVLNAAEAADKLAAVLPDLDRDTALARLESPGRFVWISRNLTPKQQYDINRLGIPGLGFQRGERRVYPHGRLSAHVLGLTDIDGRGIAGLEKRFDRTLRSGERIQVGLDMRIQAMVRDEIAAAMREFQALGAAGLVLDVHTGEVVSMVSLPDFDPNDPEGAKGDAAFNRVTKGVYEMGSTFKLFTAAMALDSGTVNLESRYDASEPIHISRFTIRDFHAMNRWLSVPEIIVHSSNIGAAKMAVDVGTETQRRYLGRLGLLVPASIELPEVGRPLTPAHWREINTMTIAYGHGIAVSPLQLASGVAALVNGGIYVPPTMLDLHGVAPADTRRVLSAATSEDMRRLMRLVVRYGTGRKAQAEGYHVGGKTGTADKLEARGYRKSATISSFVGAFPIDSPRYIVLVVMDEPKGNKRTFNYATGGWTAAPAVGHIVKHMATLLGMAPDRTEDEDAAGDALLIKAHATKPQAAPRPHPPAAPRVTAPSRLPASGSTNERRVLKRIRAVLDVQDPPARKQAAPPLPKPRPAAELARPSGGVEQALATY